MRWVAMVVIWCVGVASGCGVPRVQLGREVQIGEANKQLKKLFEVGKLDEALLLAQETVHNAEQVLGTEHPDTAAALNNLAYLYRTRGVYVLAEPLYQRALAIYEKVLGTEHPATATALDNLAGFYYTSYRKATSHYLSLVMESILRLGMIWSIIGSTVGRVASEKDERVEQHIQAQREYERAEQLYKRALAIREQVLKGDHPDTARSLNNLAMLRWHRGQLQAASNLAWQEGAVRERLVRINIASQAEVAMQTIA